jgi:hypothetical protein
MKTIIAAAVALSAMAAFEASACDWNHQAAKAPATVVACQGNGCATEDEPATTAPVTLADCSGSSCATEDEPATTAPVTLADCGGSGC